MDASITSTDDAVVLAPVVSLPGDATLTVDTNVLSSGIADQLVQALVSSGDVVVPPLPTAAVPAAVTTQVAARRTAPMLVSEMKHVGKYAEFLQPKGPAPHPEVDYLLIGLAGKNCCYACSVEGCGMHVNSEQPEHYPEASPHPPLEHSLPVCGGQENEGRYAGRHGEALQNM